MYTYLMNALWLSRIHTYKNSRHHISACTILVALKISRQSLLLKKYKRVPYEKNISRIATIEDVFLMEARAAKYYWSKFKTLLREYEFPGRKPRHEDVVNKLLDVGYHHVAGMVSSILEKHNVPSAIGLMHVAKTAKSKPLVYDIIEMFRSDLVESEVLRFLRLKKRGPIKITQRDIAHFIHEINERCERKYFLRDFRRCHTYRYYMEIQILKLLKAVNHKAVFQPLKLPSRHDMRCSLTNKEVPAIVPTGSSLSKSE